MPIAIQRQEIDSSFSTMNFKFLYSKFQGATAYGKNKFQLKEYSKACLPYHYFLDRGFLLTFGLWIPIGLVEIIPMESIYRCHYQGLMIVQYLCHRWHFRVLLFWIMTLLNETYWWICTYHEQHEGCHIWSKICSPCFWWNLCGLFVIFLCPAVTDGH